MIDLKELERRLDEALANETKDSLNKWLDEQRVNESEYIEELHCSEEVYQFSRSNFLEYLIENDTLYYKPPPLVTRHTKTKKDSAITAEFFFFTNITLW